MPDARSVDLVPTDLPAGLEHVRTTDVFDGDTVPPGLLRRHRVAEGTWGRVVVHGGTLRLVFEDDGELVELSAGDTAVVPPGRPHHVELGVGGRFAVEFHRRAG
ncbi:MAG: DUF1971 domain-containing protein [Acidimicrobiia bacterium]